MNAVTTIVTMAEIQTYRGAARFSCVGLGSCIALCALDPESGACGMAHIMLPKAFWTDEFRQAGRYADLAVPTLVESLAHMGGVRERLVVAYAGGAQVFNRTEAPTSLDIGGRNAAEVEHQLQVLGVRCLGRAVGGSLGRTVTFDSETGEVRVRTVTQGDSVLCQLRGTTR